MTRSAASSGPHVQTSPVGAGELDADRRRRARSGRAAGRRTPGAHAEVGDVPQPGGRRARPRPSGVDDVLPVRPGLHDPGGDRRGRAHVRAVPGQPGRRVERREHGEQRSRAGRAQPGEQRRRRAVARCAAATRSGKSMPCATSAAASARNAVGVGDGQRWRVVVEVGEVADLVADRPALGRGGRAQCGVGQRGEHVVQIGGLGGEVGDQRRRGRRPSAALPHRACACRGRPRGPSWASSLR